MMLRCLLLMLLFFSISSPIVLAVSDSFTVKTLIGGDVTSPSTPVLSSVAPISLDQIDLTWSASTDDFVLSGYQIFRDGVQIATTTLTSYSDSGLTNLTTYSYYVRAFDSVFNYSSSSNSIATTTFSIPIATTTPPTSGTVTGSKSSVLSLEQFTLESNMYEAHVLWTTNAFAKFQLRWGRTTSYELGFVFNDLYKKSHVTDITDLEPATVYEYELVGYTKSGTLEVLKRGSFKTHDAPDTTAPLNVQNLSGTIKNGNVYLTWLNPEDSDFDSVRIVRSHLFYPLSLVDGFLVYESNGEKFTDVRSSLINQTQYYTVFTRDRAGNTSSGAVIALSKDGVITGMPSSGISKDVGTVVFSDFEFVQEAHTKDDFTLAGYQAYIVRIAYDKVPLHLKTITYSLATNDSSVAYTYLLKLNKDKTFYEAVIPASGVKGNVSVQFVIFDFETKIMTTLMGEVTFFEASKHTPQFFAFPFTTTRAVGSESATVMFVFVLFILLLILTKLLRKIF